MPLDINNHLLTCLLTRSETLNAALESVSFIVRTKPRHYQQEMRGSLATRTDPRTARQRKASESVRKHLSSRLLLTSNTLRTLYLAHTQPENPCQRLTR